MKVSKAKINVMIFLILIVALVSFSKLAYSQGIRYQSYDECMENFDVSDAFSDRLFMFKINFQKGKIRPYIICRAVTLFDKDECMKLDDKAEINACQYEFNHEVGFWAPLATSGIITEETLKNCFINRGKNRKLCIKFAESYIKGGSSDVSICKNKQDCIAMMNLNPSIAKNPKDKDVIYFAKAIKESDIRYCSNIKDKKKARDCSAFLQRDPSLCEDQAFKRLRDSYCKYCQRKGEGYEEKK